MEGSHSPLGFIWQIASQTGWSVRHILWEVPYAVLLMMMNDAPHYITADELKRQKRKMVTAGKPVKKQSALEFFQTRLNNENGI
ncbi:MAG: hypothetical protein LBN11_07595 [Tannerella sp.]|jgi:hypothetical protein|nr:hypothetical protein [Tannerella sp.]